MYRNVLLSSFHNGKVEYCAISGPGDIEENASVIFFYSDFILHFGKLAASTKRSLDMQISLISMQGPKFFSLKFELDPANCLRGVLPYH